MRVLINDASYDNDVHSAHEIRTEIEDVLRPIFGTVSIGTTNLGLGADWPLFAVTIAALAAGKQVRDGLEGWLDLGKRFAKSIRSLHQKFGAVRLDVDAAQLIALDALPEVPAGETVTELSRSASVLVEFPDAPEGSLERTAYSLYTFTFMVSSEPLNGCIGHCFVVVVSSDLLVLNVHGFPVQMHP